MAKVAETNNARRNASPRTNREWLNDLSPPANEKALHDLRNFLLKGLTPALVKFKDRELYPFTQDVAQDTFLKILDNLDSFRGDSMFTMWAMKIAGRPAPERLPHIEDHLRKCDDCREEYKQFLIALKSADG